jgi:hypothetical protein
LAGADTDWREFRARLVAATEPTAAAPTADGDAAVDGDPDAAAVAPGTAAGWAHPLLGGPEPGAVLVAHPALFVAVGGGRWAPRPPGREGCDAATAAAVAVAARVAADALEDGDAVIARERAASLRPGSWGV